VVLRTKADCLRVCHDGPILLIWPDGITYGGVTAGADRAHRARAPDRGQTGAGVDSQAYSPESSSSPANRWISLNPATVSPQRKSDQSHDIGRYRPEIDGLRAFALIAVIINHFNRALLPSGYLGVDVFFVISGFVITSSLSKRSFNSFGEFILTFYARRIKRLIPALVLFVVITSLMISMFNPNPGPDIGVGWRALFGVSNIHLYRQSADYFSTSIDLNPFVHTWSLGVEEQFYLLFPLIAWITGFTRLAVPGGLIDFSG
jgi:hypothetical protein